MKVKSSADLRRLQGEPPKPEQPKGPDPILALAEAVKQSSESAGQGMTAVLSALETVSKQLGVKTPVNVTVPENKTPKKWTFKFQRDGNGFLQEIVARAE